MSSTPFVGRTTELQLLETHLHNPECRLLTLLGPGGIGKTRLAVEVAGRLKPAFQDGTWLVPLDSIPPSEPDLLIFAIATVLQISFSGHDSPHQQLLDALHDRHMLLVLDNFEHLSEAVEILADILNHATHVKLLVTSRERLHLQSEWVFNVTGLQIPPIETHTDFHSSSAVQLFLQVAQRAVVGFSPTAQDNHAIAEICRLVEGMPLALELSAGWLRALSCAEIAAEIERSPLILSDASYDGQARHRSINAIFDHSWQMLSTEERLLLSRLAVFQGGFQFDAAHRVAGATLPLIASLIDRSFLRRTPDERYEMHPLLRHFALEALQTTPDEHMQTRHLHQHYYFDFIRQRWSQLRSTDPIAISAVAAEIPNIRLAWELAFTHTDPTHLEKSIDALFYFFECQGRCQEGLSLFQQAIKLLETTPVSPTLIFLRLGEAFFDIYLGQYAQAHDLLLEAIHLTEQLDMDMERARAFTGLSLAYTYLNDYEQGLTYGQQSLEQYEALNDNWGMTAAYLTLGYVHQRRGDFATAQRIYRQCVTLTRGGDNQRGLALSLNYLGCMTSALGDYVGAKTMIEESLKISQQIGYPRGTAAAFYELAIIMQWGFQEQDTAMTLFEEAFQLQRKIGDQSGMGFTLNYLGELAFQRGDYGAAQLYYTDSLSVKQKVNDQWGMALALGGLGEVMGATGQSEAALNYFQEAAQLAHRIEAPTLLLTILFSMTPTLRAMQRQQEAIMVLLLVANHPMTAPYYRKLSQQQLADIEFTIPNLDMALLSDAQTAGGWLMTHLPQFAVATGLSVELLAELVTAFYRPDVPTRSSPGLIEQLTAREAEILGLLANGLSNNEIAERLFIGSATVKTHTLNIYRKLDVSNRTQAITRAQALGLL